MPIEGRAPISSSRSVNRTLVNWLPASEWVTSPTRRPRPGSSGHLDGVEDHVGTHVRRGVSADDPTTERADDETHARHPHRGRHVGQVRDPQRAGPVRGEVALHQVRARVASGSEMVLNTFFATPRDAPGCPAAHQTGDLVPADLMASTAAASHSQSAVDLAVVTHNTISTCIIITACHAPLSPRGEPALLGGVVAARSHPCRALQMGSTPSSSRCSSMNPTSTFTGGRAPPGQNTPTPSARSRLPASAPDLSLELLDLRAASAVDRPGFTPSSISATLTHLRTVSVPYPS